MLNADEDNRWLEPVLRDRLRRVAAPDELWDRVVLPRLDAPPRAQRTLVWMLAAASVFAVSVFAIAWAHHPPTSAVAGSTRCPSSQPAEIRQWIRSRTGLDIPFLVPAAPSVQMIEASLSETGGTEVKIRYRVASQDAVLRVSPSGSPAGSKHSAVPPKAAAVSWTMAGQAYTLAVERPEALLAACLICHADSLHAAPLARIERRN